MLVSKLTPAMVQTALNVASPEGLLTLLLRGRCIPYIENLEYTQDAFSVIDLTNNDIVELSGVPDLPKLEVLLLANNNISSVGKVAAESGLKSLLLMNNSLSSFAEMAKLRIFRNLENLMLIGNQVTEEHHYRLFVVWLFPKLTVLDYQKVKVKEKAAAVELFGSDYETRLPAADALLRGNKANKVAKHVLKETRFMETTMKKLLPEQKDLLVKELEKATSMEEIERVSQALKEGYVEGH